MAFIAWILLGLIAGYLGSRIINPGGEGVLFDIVLGVIGAFVGGLLFQQLDASGVSELNFWNLSVATAGSVLLVLAYHMVRRIGWSGR